MPKEYRTSLNEIFRFQVREDRLIKPMIFLNTAWMERYGGLLGTDSKISGGGSFVDEHGYGHEIFNFEEIDRKVYGYALSYRSHYSYILLFYRGGQMAV